MGDKSEAFCRQTLSVLEQNPQVVPPSVGLREAIADLEALDRLRPRLQRLLRLTERGERYGNGAGQRCDAGGIAGLRTAQGLGQEPGPRRLAQGLGDAVREVATA